MIFDLLLEIVKWSGLLMAALIMAIFWFVLLFVALYEVRDFFRIYKNTNPNGVKNEESK